MEQLKNNLKDAKLKIHETEIERDRAFDKIKQLQQRLDNYELDLRDVQDSIRTVCSSESSSSSVHSALPRGIRNVNSRYTIDPKHLARINTVNTVKPKESLMQKNTVEERRIATLPRMSGMDVIEEIRISRRTSITSLPPDIGILFYNSLLHAYEFFIWLLALHSCNLIKIIICIGKVEVLCYYVVALNSTRDTGLTSGMQARN